MPRCHRWIAGLSGLLLAPLSAQQTSSPVDDLLGSLTLEQKAGQLFVSWSLSRATRDGANHEELLGWVERVGLGGVILSLGTVDDAARLVPQLQAKSELPLLLAGDFEGGVWFRLDGATELGNQMLVGATGSAELARRMGRVTAEEAKALGFHWVFAPVLDVNSNPENPIINVRSFGEDPALVARLGTAFARGVREAGLIACGKHFPGHGDVDSDSHLELVTVNGSAERLRRVELHPFEVAARDGLESVMTGHLAVPGLGEAKNVPATLSSKILQGVLRDELGFTGLVVTDALEMGGVKNAFPPDEVAIRALLAGADVLLMPPDPVAARDAVVAAVRSGRVPAERLDDAVRRILEMKRRVGLLGGDGAAVADDWRAALWTEDSIALAREIARRGPVLVRDREDAVEKALRSGDEQALLVTLVDKDEGQGEAFVAGLDGPVAVGAGAAMRLSGSSSAEDVARVAGLVGTAKHVVLAAYVKVRAWSGGIAVPPNLKPVLDALTDDQQVVLVSFGNPYIVRGIPEADAYVAAFTDTEHVQRAVAKALRGDELFVGRLPVRIPDVAAAGTGLSTISAPGAPGRAEPGDVGLAGDLPRLLRERLETAVAARAFPGAVAVVARHGRIVAEVAVGHHSYAEGAPAVTPDTRYDLASLTKVVATTPSILKLCGEGVLSLDDPVQKWLPAFAGDGKEQVTIRHLLAHQGGLPAYVRFFRSMQGKDEILAAAAAEGLMLEPGTAVKYSDLGFMLLGAIVEKASGKPLDVYARDNVWQPLQMAATGFRPAVVEASDEIAPTERDDARGGIVHGAVHDENAFAMGGVSGHAGAFATAADVASYGVALLAGGRSVLPREQIVLATRPAGITDDTTRGLGFQLLQSGGYGGTDVPAGTFGHTGFTGTSLWCSPQNDLCVVLLTNRVHPTRVNNKITAVRRAVHDLVLDALR